jgi:tRNA A58 N-methylase Trm61
LTQGKWRVEREVGRSLGVESGGVEYREIIGAQPGQKIERHSGADGGCQKQAKHRTAD